MLVVLLDDVGFAASSAFGGPVNTPTAERLAATTDIGSDTATPVSDDYAAHESAFSGRVRWVQIDIDDAAEDLDHLITAKERMRVALARQ